MNKSERFVIYNRQNHDVPLVARQKWASDLERMKRNAERRGMKTTLEFTEFDDMTVSYLSGLGQCPRRHPKRNPERRE